jgi:hypothetical protein
MRKGRLDLSKDQSGFNWIVTLHRRKKMPEEFERGERRERDRDRDEDRWDVKPERPSKNTLEAAEDVQGLYKVAWEAARDVFREKATPQVATEIYDRIKDAREL